MQTTTTPSTAAKPITHVLVGLAFLLLPSLVPAFAQEAPELITDRPDQTESSVVVPPGSIQIELGWTMTRDDVDGVRFESSEVPGTLLRIGLAEAVELRIGWTGWVDEEVRASGSTLGVDGLGDAELGAKIHLRSENGGAPEMALLIGTSVPVGDGELTSDRFDPSLRLLLSHSLSDRIDLGYNVGLAFDTVVDDPTGSEDVRSTLSNYIYTVAMGFGLTDRLGAFVEFYGEIPASASGGPAHSFDSGLTYLLCPNLQLDLAAGLGLSEAADDWFVGLGLSVRLPR